MLQRGLQCGAVVLRERAARRLGALACLSQFYDLNWPQDGSGGRSRKTNVRLYFLAAFFVASFAFCAALAMRALVFLTFSFLRRVCTVLEWLIWISVSG